LKPHNIPQRAAAEGLGTAFLLATVVGSGVMAFKLAGGNGAVALLCNTIPTGAILTVLILTFGSVSGAHFNPAVTIAFALRRELTWSDAVVYIASQIVGAIVGVWAAHLMFELPLWQFSTTVRTGWGQWLAEGVATFGLLMTIFGCLAFRTDAIPYAVGLYAAIFDPRSRALAPGPAGIGIGRPGAASSLKKCVYSRTRGIGRSGVMRSRYTPKSPIRAPAANRQE
jgi:glycerol uptake facilitator-like aquaporin